MTFPHPGPFSQDTPLKRAIWSLTERSARPLPVLKAYWLDLCPEQNALWLEPEYLQEAA